MLSWWAHHITASRAWKVLKQGHNNPACPPDLSHNEWRTGQVNRDYLPIFKVALYSKICLVSMFNLRTVSKNTDVAHESIQNYCSSIVVEHFARMTARKGLNIGHNMLSWHGQISWHFMTRPWWMLFSLRVNAKNETNYHDNLWNVMTKRSCKWHWMWHNKDNLSTEPCKLSAVKKGQVFT